MPIGQADFGLLVAMAVAEVLLLYHVYDLYRRVASEAGAGGTAARDLVDDEERTVECPSCGAENGLEYRYCRGCVTELPTATNVERSGPGPLGRTSG